MSAPTIVLARVCPLMLALLHVWYANDESAKFKLLNLYFNYFKVSWGFGVLGFWGPSPGPERHFV